MSVAASVYASSVIDFAIEPTRALSGSYMHAKDRKVHWTIAGEYGWLLNEHLTLGPNLNFVWHLDKNRNTVDYNTYLVHSKERVIMIPVSVFIIVDPIPQYMIHPVLHAQAGYNSVFISNVNYNSSDKNAVKEFDGYYNGIIGKFSLECMVDVGKSISLFVGPQWQFSTTERRGKGYHYERKFNGFGLRFGVSALL
jgi:hypothetical protein